MNRLIGLGWTGLLAVLLATAPLAAQEVDDATRAAARTMGNEGLDAYEAGRYEEAYEKLDRAYQVVHAPTLCLWSARALEKLGRLVAAAERYREVFHLHFEHGDEAIFEKAKADAASELAALEPRIPTVRVDVEGAVREDVSVSIDGVDVPTALLGAPRPVDPGAHRVEARSNGETARAEVTLREGESKPVTLRLSGAPVPPVEGGAPPEPERDAGSSGAAQRLAGYVALGVGGVGFALGGVTGGMVLAQNSTLEEDCPDHECSPDFRDDVDQINARRTLSTIGFVIGGVAAAAGITLLATAPKRRSEPGAALWVGPGTVNISGRF